MTYNELALSLTRYIDAICSVIQINDKFIMHIDDAEEIGVEQFVSAQVDCLKVKQDRKDHIASDIISIIKGANNYLSLGSTKKLIAERVKWHKTDSELH